MNFKISVVLLHLCTITLLLGQHVKSLGALAHKIDANDTESKIGSMPSITAAMLSGTCNGRFCYSPMNETSNEMTLSYREYDQLKSTSILYGVAKIASEQPQLDKCHRELTQIYDGIRRKDIWAIKVLDSSGTPTSGFVLGHNFWMGSMRGCEAVQKPPPLTISNRFQRFMHTNLLSSTAPFDVEYRMVYAEHRSPWQVQVEFLIEKIKVLHVGLCLPVTCSNEVVANLTQEFFDSRVLDAQIMHDYQPNILEVKDLNSKTSWMERTSFQLLGCCIVFTIFMMILAHIRESATKELIVIEHTVANQPNGNGVANGGFVPELSSNPPDVVMQCQKTSTQKKVFLDELAECFSLQKNFRSLMNLDRPANAVPIVDGFKSIGCFLVLLFHIYWFNLFTVHNGTMTFSYGEQTLWQWISAMPILVDVFFTISGILLSYNFLRDQAKIEEIRRNSFMQNVKLFGKQFLNRYIRLTPLYLIIVGSIDFLTARLVETSPFWIHDRNDLTCSKYWWRNLLYIQSYFTVNDLCVNWSWSLSCEMQFFVLFTVLLFIYAKYPNAAKAIFCSLFGIFMTCLFTVAIFKKFTPAYDVMHSLGTSMYISPWTRVLPYLVGVGSGYIMFTLNGVMPLGEKTIKMLWTVMGSFAIFAHGSTLHRDISHLLAAPLITFIRIFYPLSIAWMIIASQTGHGGVFAKLMNMPIFIHLNKLSYAIYLLNPAIISVLYGWQEHSTHIDPVSMSVMAVGINVIVYISAMVFSLAFEIPYVRLSSKLLKSKSVKQNTVISLQSSETIQTKKAL